MSTKSSIKYLDYKVHKKETLEEVAKHEGKHLSKEEVMESRSSAYEFINFDKKETLEDIAQWVIEFRFTKNEYAKVSDFEMYHTVIEKVTKWQQERSYSEEEVLDILNKRGDDLDLWYNSKSISYPKEKEWFEQFKKK